MIPKPVLKAYRAGLNLIPQLEDKRIPIKWKRWQTERVPEETLMRWAAKNPPMWAIVCGKISGIIVLDFDVDHGGLETFDDIRLRARTKTKSGGYHVYVRYPGLDIVSGFVPEFKGMEVRSNGTLATLVGPGYSRLDGSKLYVFDELPDELQSALRARERRKLEADLPPVPDDFEDRMEIPELLQEAIDRSEEDGRNNAGFWLASQLRDERYDEDDAWKVMKKYVSKVGAGTYTQSEAYASLRQAWAQPARLPRRLYKKWRQVDAEKILLTEQARHRARITIRTEEARKNFREPEDVGSAALWLAKDDDPLEWMIYDLQPIESNVVLMGQYKTGKTTMILNLIRSLADGTPFLGRFNPNGMKGNIAVWNYEMSPRQFKAWMRKLNLLHPGRVVPLNLRGRTTPLINDAIQDWAIKWLAERGIKYWIIDPLARAMVGSVENENDNSQVARFLDALDRVKADSGVEGLVVTSHGGRGEVIEGQERTRGATRIDDWRDVGWFYTKDDKGTRFFRADGRDVEVPEFDLTFDKDTLALTIGDVGGSRKEVRDERYIRDVVEVVRLNPGCSYSELEGLLEINKTKRPWAVKQAIKRGLIERQRDPNHAQRFQHYLKGQAPEESKEGDEDETE